MQAKLLVETELVASIRERKEALLQVEALTAQLHSASTALPIALSGFADEHDEWCNQMGIELSDSQ